MSNTVEAILRGAGRAYGRLEPEQATPTSDPSRLSQLLAALASEQGAGLVNLAVEVACRTTLQTYLRHRADEYLAPGSKGVSAGNNTTTFTQQVLKWGLKEYHSSRCVAL